MRLIGHSIAWIVGLGLLGAIQAIDDHHHNEPWHSADVTAKGRTRLLKEEEMVAKSLTGTLGSRLMEPFCDYTKEQATPDNTEPWFPGCPFFDAINRDPDRGCTFIRAQKDLLTAVWVDFSKTSSTTRPLNPQGVLPEMLADFRPNPPKEVDRVTIYKERPTYYFCYRLILLFYSIAFQYETSMMRSALPQFLDDWHSQKYYMVSYFRARRGPLFEKKEPPKKSPIAVSMLKGDKMLIVIRGTIWTEEWCKDFEYRWAKDETKLFPGRTHQGMYSVFIEFYQELEAEVKRIKPAYILVTGHSLGAGLANMVGVRLQNVMGYQPRVDVIGFGGPNTGDYVFAEEMRTTLNSRHIIFLGQGKAVNSALYTAGDITAQYTCGPYPACDAIDTGPSTSSTGQRIWYDYERPHNQVPFYPDELPNTEEWRRVGNIKRSPSLKGIIASHICSYICWTSQAIGDLDNRCHFPEEEGRPDLPQSYLCDVSQVPV